MILGDSEVMESMVALSRRCDAIIAFAKWYRNMNCTVSHWRNRQLRVRQTKERTLPAAMRVFLEYLVGTSVLPTIGKRQIIHQHATPQRALRGAHPIRTPWLPRARPRACSASVGTQ